MVSISPTARTFGNRDDSENRVTRIADSALPTAHGDFRAVAYRDDVLDVDHVALVLGNNQMVEAPQSGDVVKISPLRTSGAMPYVVRLTG